MLALLLTGSLFGLGPTDEGAVYEPENRPGPIEPIEINIAPAPEPAPAPAPALESEPQPRPFTPSPRVLPPPPPPPTGNGRLVGGTFGIVLGVAAAVALGVETSRAEGNPRFAAGTFIPLALTGIGVGTYMVAKGAKTHRNFLDWEAYTQRDALPSGDGLIVGGTFSGVIGAITLVVGVVQAQQPGGLDRPLAPTLLGVGATGVAVGIAALTIGLLQRRTYTRWRESTFLGQLAPTLSPVIALGSDQLVGAEALVFVARCDWPARTTPVKHRPCRTRPDLAITASTFVTTRARARRVTPPWS